MERVKGLAALTVKGARVDGCNKDLIEYLMEPEHKERPGKWDNRSERELNKTADYRIGQAERP